GPGATVDFDPSMYPREGIPRINRVSPTRPRKGQLVRVYGENFNAIDGNPDQCANEAPFDPCSAKSCEVETANEGPFGNGLELDVGETSIPLHIDAVTPTMMAFEMPVDCYARGTILVLKHDAMGGVLVSSDVLPFCDEGC